MSIETLTPLSNDVRYDVKLNYYKVTSYVLYEMVIHDLAMGKSQNIAFRFSEIKKFHEELIKKYKLNKDKLPEFPKKNSFGLWNRTNRNSRMIDDRKRDLEYYFTKLLNDPYLRSLPQIKVLHYHISLERRRTRSMIILDELRIRKQGSESEKSHKAASLPKEKIRSFCPHKKQAPFSFS